MAVDWGTASVEQLVALGVPHSVALAGVKDRESNGPCITWDALLGRLYYGRTDAQPDQQAGQPRRGYGVVPQDHRLLQELGVVISTDLQQPSHNGYWWTSSLQRLASPGCPVDDAFPAEFRGIQLGHAASLPRPSSINGATCSSTAGGATASSGTDGMAVLPRDRELYFTYMFAQVQYSDPASGIYTYLGYKLPRAVKERLFARWAKEYPELPEAVLASWDVPRDAPSGGPPSPNTQSYHEAQCRKFRADCWAALQRQDAATDSLATLEGVVPLPDWLGALGPAGSTAGGSIPLELRSQYRVDPYGNVVCWDAEPGSICAWDVDHVFPRKRGGRSVLQNMAATHWYVNRHIKMERILATVLMARDGRNPLTAGLTETALCALWQARQLLPPSLQPTQAFTQLLRTLLGTAWRRGGDSREVFNTKAGLLHTTSHHALFAVLLQEFQAATTSLVAGWHVGLLASFFLTPAAAHKHGSSPADNHIAAQSQDTMQDLQSGLHFGQHLTKARAKVAGPGGPMDEFGPLRLSQSVNLGEQQASFSTLASTDVQQLQQGAEQAVQGVEAAAAKAVVSRMLHGQGPSRQRQALSEGEGSTPAPAAAGRGKRPAARLRMSSAQTPAATSAGKAHGKELSEGVRGHALVIDQTAAIRTYNQIVSLAKETDIPQLSDLPLVVCDDNPTLPTWYHAQETAAGAEKAVSKVAVPKDASCRIDQQKSDSHVNWHGAQEGGLPTAGMSQMCSDDTAAMAAITADSGALPAELNAALLGSGQPVKRARPRMTSCSTQTPPGAHAHTASTSPSGSPDRQRTSPDAASPCLPAAMPQGKGALGCMGPSVTGWVNSVSTLSPAAVAAAAAAAAAAAGNSAFIQPPIHLPMYFPIHNPLVSASPAKPRNPLVDPYIVEAYDFVAFSAPGSSLESYGILQTAVQQAWHQYDEKQEPDACKHTAALTALADAAAEALQAPCTPPPSSPACTTSQENAEQCRAPSSEQDLGLSCDVAQFNKAGVRPPAGPPAPGHFWIPISPRHQVSQQDQGHTASVLHAAVQAGLVTQQGLLVPPPAKQQSALIEYAAQLERLCTPWQHDSTGLAVSGWYARLPRADACQPGTHQQPGFLTLPPGARQPYVLKAGQRPLHASQCVGPAPPGHAAAVARAEAAKGGPMLSPVITQETSLQVMQRNLQIAGSTTTAAIHSTLQEVTQTLRHQLTQSADFAHDVLTYSQYRESVINAWELAQQGMYTNVPLWPGGPQPLSNPYLGPGKAHHQTINSQAQQHTADQSMLGLAGPCRMMPAGAPAAPGTTNEAVQDASTGASGSESWFGKVIQSLSLRKQGQTRPTTAPAAVLAPGASMDQQHASKDQQLLSKDTQQQQVQVSEEQLIIRQGFKGPYAAAAAIAANAAAGNGATGQLALSAAVVDVQGQLRASLPPYPSVPVTPGQAAQTAPSVGTALQQQVNAGMMPALQHGRHTSEVSADVANQLQQGLQLASRLVPEFTNPVPDLSREQFASDAGNASQVAALQKSEQLVTSQNSAVPKLWASPEALAAMQTSAMQQLRDRQVQQAKEEEQRAAATHMLAVHMAQLQQQAEKEALEGMNTALVAVGPQAQVGPGTVNSTDAVGVEQAPQGTAVDPRVAGYDSWRAQHFSQTGVPSTDGSVHYIEQWPHGQNQSDPNTPLDSPRDRTELGGTSSSTLASTVHERSKATGMGHSTTTFMASGKSSTGARGASVRFTGAGDGDGADLAPALPPPRFPQAVVPHPDGPVSPASKVYKAGVITEQDLPPPAFGRPRSNSSSPASSPFNNKKGRKRLSGSRKGDVGVVSSVVNKLKGWLGIPVPEKTDLPEEEPELHIGILPTSLEVVAEEQEGEIEEQAGDVTAPPVAPAASTATAEQAGALSIQTGTDHEGEQESEITQRAVSPGKRLIQRMKDVITRGVTAQPLQPLADPSDSSTPIPSAAHTHTDHSHQPVGSGSSSRLAGSHTEHAGVTLMKTSSGRQLAAQDSVLDRPSAHDSLRSVDSETSTAAGTLNQTIRSRAGKSGSLRAAAGVAMPFNSSLGGRHKLGSLLDGVTPTSNWQLNSSLQGRKQAPTKDRSSIPERTSDQPVEQPTAKPARRTQSAGRQAGSGGLVPYPEVPGLPPAAWKRDDAPLHATVEQESSGPRNPEAEPVVKRGGMVKAGEVGSASATVQPQQGTQQGTQQVGGRKARHGGRRM